MRVIMAAWLGLVGAIGALHLVQADPADSGEISYTDAGSWLHKSTHPRQLASSTTTAIDFCAPCTNGDQCSTGLCLIPDGNTIGTCTQTCSSSVACPTGFSCVSSSGSTNQICQPEDASTCPSIYAGTALNDQCIFPVSTSNPNLVQRVCQSGLTCMVYPSGVGACLTLCSSIDPNYSCAASETCCFGIDSNHYCAASTSTQNIGGCIEIQAVGESCTDPNQSVCASGAGCMYTTSLTDSRCYTLCDGNSTYCSTGGICVEVHGVNVCCNANSYVNGSISTCVPAPGKCLLGVGVACDSDDECKQSLCLHNGKKSACSMRCSSDSQCPGDDDDVNEDGVADGGSSCITFPGSLNYCWPKLGPASKPNCALDAEEASTTGGCSCQAIAPSLPVWLVAWGGLTLRLWRRRRRSC